MWYKLPFDQITFDQLEQNIAGCRLCADLYGIDPKPFFWGQKSAKIMQISQSPSYRVHLSGKPFDDDSGVRLRRWYGLNENEFYDKHNFYLTSFAHCYFGKTAKGISRTPPKVCAQIWLKREIQLVQCQMYIFVGAVIANYLLGEKRPLEQYVFDSSLTFNGKPAIVIPHPSPLNKYWLDKYGSRFENERLPQIRQLIWKLIEKN